MRLPVPNSCSLQLVDDVVAERQNGVNAAFFTSIRADWRAKVQEYIGAGGSPQFVQPWPDVAHRKNKFLNLYLSPKKASAHGLVLDQLRDHGLNLCPACGEAGAPNTLDHYLPKGIYPHFCITPHNLFPMCDACQGKKLEKTGDAANPRFFIHPYFDVFVAEQVIKLLIDPPFDTPTFNLIPDPELPAEQLALVESHVRELAIDQRYGHFFREQHRRLIRLVQIMRNSGLNVADTLEMFRVNSEDPSANSWEHVFYAAVLSNAAMLNYLETEPLPTLP
ncbi:hypothetical protein FHS21_003325 [Phyllobacterium trifolii]|uniref:HNH endonuclease n=1 Tax=Phyllobacterium trifolii TaxID=300193 RepID=A0A839UEN6_9HYPH|nr:hypothetical protein [Phyllobacterium trifolii]MBB3146909.1 hypothetical protein [Phyllobacterium trifolii]